jgi:hypothetical protein
MCKSRLRLCRSYKDDRAPRQKCSFFCDGRCNTMLDRDAVCRSNLLTARKMLEQIGEESTAILISPPMIGRAGSEHYWRP